MAFSNLKNEKFFLSLIKQGKLKVTKDGRAFNLVTGRELSKARQCDCYRKLSWQHPRTKKIKQIQLHRLIWAYFNGIPSDKLVINHIDGNKQNCALENLELVSIAENNKHAFKNNLVYILKGEDKSNSIFSDDDVFYLRKLYATTNITIKDIASRFKCSKTSVYSMLKGKWYKHIKTKYDVLCLNKIKGAHHSFTG